MLQSFYMKELLLIANWKNYIQDWKEAVRVAKHYPDSISSVKVVACVSDIFAAKVAWEFPSKVGLGLQNIEAFDGGSVVGFSTLQSLRAIGAGYVVLGHSWRRAHVLESNEIVNSKLHVVLDSEGVTPVVCVGESNRDEGYLDVLEDQIRNTFAGITREQLDSIIVAYEPVWAIGATEPATAEDVRKIVLFIKRILMEMTNDSPVGRIRVIYGGSVNAEMDIAAFLEESESEGFLVGRASVDAAQFTVIRDKMGEFIKG